MFEWPRIMHCLECILGCSMMDIIMITNFIPVQIIGSLVNFEGKVLFINNTQDNAVAMHLLSFGQARVFAGLQLTFWGCEGT